MRAGERTTATGRGKERAPESWRTVLDAVPAAVVIVDPDGTISFVNAELERLTGYSRAELCGEPIEGLETVAGRLTGAVRPEDTVARFGGDEFVVLCENLADPDDAVRVANRIVDELGRPIRHRTGESRVAASIGVVLARGPADGPELIEAADRAMYRAKSRGGEAVEFDRGSFLRQQTG